jgi:hypothetical protein
MDRRKACQADPFCQPLEREGARLGDVGEEESRRRRHRGQGLFDPRYDIVVERIRARR